MPDLTARAAASIGVHPTDAEFRADPYPFYRALREQAPVWRLPGWSSWVVTGYQEARALLRDSRVSVRGPAEVPARADRSQTGFLSAREEAVRLVSCFVLQRSQADHARLRRLLQPALSPRRVAERRARLQRLTDDRIGEALERGRIDVVNDLGRPVAVDTAGEVLGIPEAVRPAFGDLARELVYAFNVFPFGERGLLAMTALAPRLRDLVSGWKARPPAEDNLLWALEQARSRGEVSEAEAIAHGALLLFAGHITSQHLIGNGVLALLRHPDQWNLLRAEPALIETAVEELLRYDTPSPVAPPRTALADLEIGGETIGKGASLTLLLGAANRDPAVFSDPDRLDITRSPNPHLGFGHDAHYCIGAALGRLEAQVVIGTLVRRVREAHLEGELLEWEDTFAVRGLRSLPVVLA